MHTRAIRPVRLARGRVARPGSSVTKLAITRCTVEGGQTTEHPGDVFRATINPADYKHSFGIAYSGRPPRTAGRIGKSGVTPKFSSVNSEKIAFSIVLDGTGVVPDTAGRSVADQMRALKAIVYAYSGSDHEPNVVKIAWGRGLTAFYGRLESMTAELHAVPADRRGAARQGRPRASSASPPRWRRRCAPSAPPPT